MCLYVRELKIDEGQKIQRILRRSTSRVKVRRAQVVLASEQGYKAPAIAELVHYSEHHVRAIIKEFNKSGLKALEPKPRSGRPAEFTEDDKALIADTAKCPPDLLGCPFKRWSLEKLREYLAAEKIVSSISIETLRTILHERKVRLRRTKTWKECNDPRPNGYTLFAGVYSRVDKTITQKRGKKKAPRKMRVHSLAKERWSSHIPLTGKALVLADEVLFVAGTPVAFPSDDLAKAYEGRMGGILWAASSSTGKN
jgi:transposase